MDSSFSTTSRRSYDIPTPETGLAEWTSKIKALQREVDADEEAEQKRLEEEISAARQARLRRSRGPGAGGRVDSVDMHSSKEQFQRFDSTHDSSTNDTPRSTAERINDQETALRKLMGRNEVYNPDMNASSTRAEKSNTPSLAAFIGGRATGPRLNKHAPQVDAHDPTQFIQPDLSTPHPIFGRGGVAMPGMEAKKDNRISSTIGTESSERYRPSSVVTAPMKSPPPPAANQFVEKVSEPVKRDSSDLHRPFTTPKELVSTALPTIKPVEKVDNPADHSPYASNELLQRNQNSFASTTRPLSSAPKKEEPAFRGSSPPSNSYRSSVSSTSRVVPTYGGTTTSAKFNTSTNLPKKVVEPSPNLRRMMQANHVHNPDNIEADAPRKTIAERAQGVSLAGFMGGNATGPRLNRHAPQVDAHDPTQFIQPDTSAPHPIFGRGGVAMPGMAARKTTDPGAASESSERHRPFSASKPVWPPVATNYANKGQDQPISPQKSGNRERTTSAPGSRPNFGSSTSQSSGGWTPPTTSFNSVRNPSPTKDLRPKTPVRDRTISGPSYSQNAGSISTPSLARPIQPKPKNFSQSPQIVPPGVVVPSPAFQKPTPSKDLTPSISRLQGRGFVQNMVKVSAQLEVPASPTPQGSTESRPTSAAGRKGSVLDRWQPNAQASSPTKSSSFPDPMRRSTTQQPTAGHSYSPRTPTSANFTGNSTHSLKSVASLPSIAKSASAPSKVPTPEPVRAAEPYPRSRTPGLGSATTMVLIKPSKSSGDLTQLSHIDELGVKHDSQGARTDRTQFHIPAEIPPSSKKPLIHPTKDRAKRPKNLKHGDTRDHVHEVVDQVSHPLSASPEPQTHNLQSEIKPKTQTSEQLDTLSQDPHKTASSPSGSLHKAIFAEKSVPNIETKSDIFGYAMPSDTTLAEAKIPRQVPSPVIERNLTLEMPPPKSPFGYTSSTAVPLSPAVASSLSKHVRIPSTGNRPTVMEVAQFLSENPANVAQTIELTNDSGSSTDENLLSPEPATPRSRANFSQMQAEKRKSSYEKYSAIILPPLKEEATPTPTPAGTLNRADGRMLADLPTNVIVSETKPEGDVSPNKEVTKPKNDPESVVHIAQSEPSLPYMDITKLLKSQHQVPKVSSEVQTVSVEVLAITGTTATPITGPSDIFYDTEILTIIHRLKSKSTGLVSTSVWCWLGSRGILGDREERKLNDLAKRYGTPAKLIHQQAETSELIQVLGGSLAIRQGTRTHWSAENTTMHLVRSLNGSILIDEHDLNIKNLCSAFSYCLTILGSIYVWHGRGSTTEERNAALKYSTKMTHDSIPPIELLEGETDDDEMFWMILGDDDYAKADYWRWRKTSTTVDPSIWRISLDDARNPVVPVEFISMDQVLHTSVYVINCIWELFILVGKEARGDREAIRFALDVATKLSKQVASSRPYTPTVHTLILPSQVPLDLRLSVRDLDEAWLNDGQIPDHMNLLSCSEAVNHLSTRSWKQPALKDPNMLPLGVGLTEVC